MSGPDWLDDCFAAVMVVVAIYSAGRLVASRGWSRPTHADVDVAHVLMGVGMAGMLSSAINPVPRAVWEVVFTALVAWFVWRCYRFATRLGLEGQDPDHVHHLSHYLTHLVMAAAMLYMYLVAAAPSGPSRDAGMAMNGATGTTADFVGLPLLFLLVLLASGIWELDGIGRFSPALSTGPVASVGSIATRPWLAPRLEAGCHIAMCIAMAYMLVLIL
ncbi:MAG TPA: DUF5134 domain-containing protein [Acidimicrobiales bacterium]|nr:DUF5134 domain-containing protein [Acidimicrobiales bacterium]